MLYLLPMKNKSKNQEPATKKDIALIRDDLKRFATGTELKKTEKSLREEILRVEERLENTEEKILKQMGEQHDEVMTSLSNFAGRTKDLEDENAVGVKHTRELRVEFDDHEKRIRKLETPN